MAGRHDVNKVEGQKVIEQAEAAIERAVSVQEDGLEALHTEVESLISSLSGKGSIAVKRLLHQQWDEAIDARPVKGEVVPASWESYEGVPELVTEGAGLLADGVRLQLRKSEVARKVAEVTLKAWLRIPNKAGNPDIMSDSDEAKNAARALYAKAGEGFEHTFENEEALRSLIRSVQYHRSNVRAAFLRSLDENPEARAPFAKLLEGKPKDTPASEYVADAYGAPLIGDGEKKALKWADDKKGDEPSRPVPAEAILSGIKSAQSTVARIVRRASALPADSDERLVVRARLDETIKALQDLRKGL